AAKDLLGKGEIIDELRALYEQEKERGEIIDELRTLYEQERRSAAVTDLIGKGEEAFMKMEEAYNELQEVKSNSERRMAGFRRELEEEGKALNALTESMVVSLRQELVDLKQAAIDKDAEIIQLKDNLEKLVVLKKAAIDKDAEIIQLKDNLEKDAEIIQLKDNLEKAAEMRDGAPEMRDGVQYAIAAAEVEAQLLEAERLGALGDFSEARKASILQRAIHLTGTSKEMVESAAKEVAVMLKMEQLTLREKELDDILTNSTEEHERAEAAVLNSTDEHEKAEKARRELRNFKVGVMSAVAKIEPQSLKAEEVRQREGKVEGEEVAQEVEGEEVAQAVEGEEVAQAVKDYIEAQPDHLEIYLRSVMDHVSCVFPFLDITDDRKQARPFSFFFFFITPKPLRNYSQASN
ncbi:hypothetical protein T484DRAFT_1766017, partial [Baffinella frigidus]